MRDFFRSTRFKVIMIIVVILVFTMIIAGNLSGWSSPQSTVAGAVTTPLQKFTSGLSHALNDFFSVWDREKTLKTENEELRKQVEKVTQDLIDYQTIRQENEFLSEYLEIKKENPTFKWTPASVIARDPMDHFGSFTIDKGTLNGISAHDPVITSA